MDLIGNVQGKNVIIVDDILDTGGTLCKAAELIIENGALSVSAMVTHGLFSGDAINNINKSVLNKVYVSNSVSKNNLFKDKQFSNTHKIQVIDIKSLLSNGSP